MAKNESTSRSKLILRSGALATIALLFGSASAVAQVAAPVSLVEYTVDTPQQSISLEMVTIAPRVMTLPLAAGRKLQEQMPEQSKPQ
jgi:hypothetical protein